MVIDTALARSLVGAQFPEWARLPLEPVRPRGTDNALFRLGEDMVVRMPVRDRTRETLLKERRWLPVLAPSLPLAVPVPLAEGRPPAAYPFEWSIYTWLDGEPATQDRIGDEAGDDLARFLQALQRIEAAGAPAPGDHNFFRGAPLRLRDTAAREAIASVAEIDRVAVTKAWEEALAADDWTHPRVWIHGDLDSRNVLAIDGRISSVIDWGGLAAGDPAADVMVAWKMLPAEARQTFRSRLGVDEATWVRARGWVISQAVIALAYYTDETNPTLVAEARRWLAEASA